MKMSTKSKIEKWLLADWSTNQNFPVAVEDVKVIPMDSTNQDSIQQETIYERPLLEQPQRLTKASECISKEENIPRKGRDYSPSGSSWAPSDHGSSSDESDTKEVQTRSIKMEQYVRHYAKRRSGKSVPVPIHRPNAVVNVLKERQNNTSNKTNNQNRKRKYKETRSSKSLPDSTKKNLPPHKDPVESVLINKTKVLEIKASFDELFKMIDNMKPESLRNTRIYNNITTNDVLVNENLTISPVYNNTDVEEHERSQGEESNRSDDNVLISNKYTRNTAHVSQDQNENGSHLEPDEWVPIGSGKTLIHKDKYRKVNWRSYTIATRTLLLATFPRRILATHSLTGKRSPAFQDKPAKMCLDPKIVSDIIIEITSKFNVKENLVRNAITTKCADECKMYKTRTQNRNKLLKSRENALSLNKCKPETRTVKTE